VCCFCSTHLPFPSGGNKWGGHIIFLVLLFLIFAGKKTLSAGSNAFLSHIFICIAGYHSLYRILPMRLVDDVHVAVPSATRRAAVHISSAVKGRCGFLRLLILFLL